VPSANLALHARIQFSAESIPGPIPVTETVTLAGTTALAEALDGWSDKIYTYSNKAYWKQPL
jgi:hypothetical protein